MVTFLITSLVILGFLGLAIYFWQKPAPQADVELLPPLRDNRTLFEPPEILEVASEPVREEQQAKILAHANSGGLTALNDAARLEDKNFYNEVMGTMLSNANDSKLVSIASYVSRNNLDVTISLAERFRQSWQANPNRQSTATMLHLAALANDAATFTTAVEALLKVWQDKKLNDVSAEELNSLINSEYWLLSSEERSSGAGFVLKQTIAKAKSELT